ncbi:hypothetical protein [Patulibacter medicamentivorans]|uniref:hypothetical protein n=1 Tax=Patulibacter medicamentivorans TaxID=1097667 RepID=UPI001FCBC6F2|nr:hypothetical protein [Patulibacter medicamentivorans]
MGVLALGVAGCGSSDGGATTVIEKVVEPAAGQETKTVTKTEKAEPSEPETHEADTSASEGGDGCIEVPNVVGKDHQLGQDTMQAAGLYNLSEEDATGKGRALLWDRNWVDVRQSPSAGRCVSPDTTVILYAKKDGE